MAPEQHPQHNPVTSPVHRAASLFPTSVTSGSYGRRRRVRRAVTAGVVLVALAGGGIAVAQTTGKTAISYRTAEISQHDVSATIDGVSTIQPVAQANVAFPMAGTVTGIAVKLGDTVTAGETLGQLDTAAMLVTVRAKEAALDKAKLVLATALAGDDVSSLTGGSFGSSYVMSDTAVKLALAALPAADPGANDGGLAAAQQAVLDAQKAVDAAIDEAGSALASATQVCGAIGGDPSGTDAGAVTTAVSACQTALNTVVTKQAAVQTAQNNLAAASTALDNLLAQLAQQVTTTTTPPTTAATTTPATTTPATTPSTTPTTLPTTSDTTPAASTTTTEPAATPSGAASTTTSATTSTTTTPPLDQPATAGQPSAGVGGAGGSGSGATGGGAGSGGAGGGDQTSSTVSTGGAGKSGRSGSGGSVSRSGGSGGTAGGAAKKVPTAADLVAYQKAVDSAQSAVAVAYLDVAQATISTPIAGQVIAVNIAAGDTVTAASTTANIIIQGNDGYEATTTVSLAKVAEVKVGATASVLPDGSPTAYAGKVVSVAIVPATSTTGTTTFGVAIALDGDTSALHNGGIGSVSIVTGTTAAAMTVPTSAVTTLGALHTVTVLDGSTPTTTIVQVGVVGPVWTEITSGLTAGQQVVLATVSKPLPSSATSAANATTSRQITLPGGRTFTIGAGGFGGGAARP